MRHNWRVSKPPPTVAMSQPPPPPPCPSPTASTPPACGYYSGAGNGVSVAMMEAEAGTTCPAPTTSCFAGNQTQVASGVRGNTHFAARADFQQCFDSALYKMCDPRQGNNCTQVLADGVATCQLNVDRRVGMAHVCPTFTNAGYVNPQTASVHSADGIDASATFDWMTHTCNTGFKGPTPSPAQGCLEDIEPSKLASAGLAQGPTTYTSTVPRPVAGPSGTTSVQATYSYTAPEVGQNAVMRMSRMPVFLDMTQPTAAQALAKNFYAMHKRWGGSDNAPCCGGPEEPAAACASGGTTGGATCATAKAPECPAPATQKKCNHPHNWWNGGVRKENVYIADRAAAPTSTQADPASWQQTLCLRMQGQHAKVGSSATASEPASGLPALGRTVELGDSDVHNYTTYSATKGHRRRQVACETCKAYPEDATNAQRVGAVLSSAHNYGSGLFEVYARVPPGNPQERGGLGYVFAMWTFNYHETYPLYTMPASFPNVQSMDGGWAVDPAGQQLVGNIASPNPVLGKHMEYRGQNRFSCGLFSHNCDLTQNWCPRAKYGAPGQRACGLGGSALNDGPFTTWNHEIDIEIPTNACRMPKVNTCGAGASAGAGRPAVPPEGICGWNTDTINLNSWIGDDEDYKDGSPYRNNGVRRMDGGSFIARKQNDFHWYGIVWCTGDDDKHQKPYIDFYIDRQLVHRVTDTFVPSRAGKLNVGPWFGWWGGNAEFANREVWIKYLNIVPFAAVNDPFLAEPAAPVDVATLAAHWTGAHKGLDPEGQPPFQLPKLTASQLNQLYTTVAATQTDAPTPPCDWRIHTCDVKNAANDINSPQVFDQCGDSALKNICDFAEFLVAGQEGVPASLPGQVLAAVEPRKCVRAYAGKVVGETLAQQFTVDGTSVVTQLDATLDRGQYFDVSVDPDPDMTSNVRPKFQQDQFTRGADGEGAVLCGMPTATRYCTEKPQPKTTPQPQPQPRPQLTVATADRPVLAACARVTSVLARHRWPLLSVLGLLFLAVLGGWWAARHLTRARARARAQRKAAMMRRW